MKNSFHQVVIYVALVLFGLTYLSTTSIVNAEKVLPEPEQDTVLLKQFEQNCLIKDTREKVACRKLFLNNSCIIMDTKNDKNNEEALVESTGGDKCKTIFRQKCREEHFHNALCLVMFHHEFVDRIGKTSSVTAAMNDSFVREIMSAHHAPSLEPYDCNYLSALYVNPTPAPVYVNPTPAPSPGRTESGCYADDEDCLADAITQGLESANRILGIVESALDAYEVFEETLKLLAKITPFLEAGIFFLELFVEAREDAAHAEIVKKIDALEKKINDIEKAIGRLPNEFASQICNSDYQKILNDIKNYQLDYDDIERSTSKKDKKTALKTWRNHCRNGANARRSLSDTLIHIHGLVDNQAGPDQECANNWYKSVNGRGRKFYEEFSRPVLSSALRAMKLISHCPGITKARREYLQKCPINDTISAFKNLGDKAEKDWKVQVKSDLEDSKGYLIDKNSATAIRLTLENEYAFGYIYSVVKFRSDYNKDSDTSSIQNPNPDQGIVIAQHNKGDHVFIFFRKKEQKERESGIKTYGKKLLAWENEKSENKHCHVCEEETYYWEWLQKRYYCWDRWCERAHDVLIEAPHYNNRLLSNSLHEGGGSAMFRVKKWDKICEKTCHRHGCNNTNRCVEESIWINSNVDISENPYYELNRDSIVHEGPEYNAYDYKLVYPRHKKYMYNVARGKPASQSSTMNYHTANRAIDGNRWVFSRTSKEKNPWWEVDLFVDTFVNSIQIYNPESSQEQLRDVIVELINSREEIVWREQYEDGQNNYFEVTHVFGSINKTGKKVRVSLKGGDRSLALAEVEVYNGM